MYGILRIDPEGYEPADKEYFMTVKEWDSRLNRMMAGEDAQYSPRQRNPDVFTINGKSVCPARSIPRRGRRSSSTRATRFGFIWSTAATWPTRCTPTTTRAHGGPLTGRARRVPRGSRE
jgi:hypothetical protein